VDFFRGLHSWDKLYSLIEYLPWDSAYKLAMADDEDLARQLITEEADGSRASIPITQWDHIAELRASILDGLYMVARTIVAVNTPKGKRVPDFPRQPQPETAAQRLERQRRDSIMSELEAQVAGLNDRWQQ
jgi:hypothetical protein